MLKNILILGICLLIPITGYAKDKDVYCGNFLNFYGDVETYRKTFEKQPEETAWQWFTCLNKSAGENAVFWEMLKPTSEVYLTNGAAPSSFDQRTPTPDAVIKAATKIGMDTSKIFHNLDSNLQVDGLALEMGGDSPKTKTAQLVRYQLLMSLGTFNYIVEKKVYNVNGQQALTADLDFPASAWELKTSWLWVGSDTAFLAKLEADGYYIVNGYYKNESGTYQVGYGALSGMHVINKLVDDWVWATFENVNNSKYTITNHIPPTPMTNQTGPNKATKKINVNFQKNNPKLKAYELIGVQWELGSAPQLLASSQMESAFQSHSSCVACHFTAAYSKNDGYYNFALKEQGGILYPIEKTPDSAFKNYKKLDFVWSLKRASWER